MPYKYEIINCQDPYNNSNIKRTYKVIKFTFDNNNPHAPFYYNKAWGLAQKVNPHKANDSINKRDKDRLILDTLGGVLSEYGWYFYIKEIFGDIVSFTPFQSASNQIDLLLNNGKKIEVRSSFPRNGIKFALCNERYHFKNICKYDNLYKPNEVDKDFFACVLFETPKADMLESKNIIFYLIGGSTREMMEDESISFKSDLVAEDDLTQEKTTYKVIKLSNALDIEGFEKYMINMGYKYI